MASGFPQWGQGTKTANLALTVRISCLKIKEDHRLRGSHGGSTGPLTCHSHTK